jgi:hypothetical protein
VVDGQEATASPIPAGGAASISVSGFSLPGGAIITDAELQVVHHEDYAMQSDNPNPTWQPLSIAVTDGATPVQSQSFPLDQACEELTPPRCTTGLNITTALQNDPALVGRLTATVTTTAPAGAGGPYSSSVDGIQLALDVYLPGGYRPLVGCTQQTLGTLSNPQQPCPLVSTVPGATLYVQGTVYAPTGGLDVNGQPNDPVRFNRGIVARTVVFRPGNGGSTAGVTAGGAFNRWVVLDASVNANLRVATTVIFDDVQAFIEKRLPTITYNNWDLK